MSGSEVPKSMAFEPGLLRAGLWEGWDWPVSILNWTLACSAFPSVGSGSWILLSHERRGSQLATTTRKLRIWHGPWTDSSFTRAGHVDPFDFLLPADHELAQAHVARVREGWELKSCKRKETADATQQSVRCRCGRESRSSLSAAAEARRTPPDLQGEIKKGQPYLIIGSEANCGQAAREVLEIYVLR